jgi:dihydrofolate synthase/folylpolyglutamate synthase
MKITNFTEANKYLAQFYANIRPNYTLDTMQGLLEYLGNPQETFRVIHVAGTSGKTSTAYYTSALLTAVGYKTGLTVSPHVDEVNERVQINAGPISETDFCTALTAFAQVLEASDFKPSWFETMVAFAYWYFAREAVDYAVIEVGLGGLLDGTNVIRRPDKTCAITDIGFDHTQILGDTLSAIAAQKAGIIQEGNDVVMYAQNQEVMDVVRAQAAQKHAELTVITDYDTSFDLPKFQQRNFGLAKQAVSVRLQRDGQSPLSADAAKTAAKTYIPGRMEVIPYGDKTIILDGAHNAQKLEVLADALHVKYPGTAIAALVGFAEGDEDRLRGSLEALKHISSNCIVTSFVSAEDNIKQAVAPAVVAEQAGFAVQVEPDAAKAFELLMQQSEPVLVVAGSFYLLNHIRPLMLKA